MKAKIINLIDLSYYSEKYHFILDGKHANYSQMLKYVIQSDAVKFYTLEDNENKVVTVLGGIFKL